MFRDLILQTLSWKESCWKKGNLSELYPMEKVILVNLYSNKVKKLYLNKENKESKGSKVNKGNKVNKGGKGSK